MVRVFSYGSLQLPAVQLATFGRLLKGSADALPGFELGTVQHGERQLANLKRCAGVQSPVSGTVFELTDAELETADAYERADAYARIPVSLESGIEAWVYVAGGIHEHRR